MLLHLLNKYPHYTSTTLKVIIVIAINSMELPIRVTLYPTIFAVVVTAEVEEKEYRWFRW